MARYRVVEPCAVVQGGRAWQVGDEVELPDAQAADLGSVVTLLKSESADSEESEPAGEADGQ